LRQCHEWTTQSYMKREEGRKGRIERADGRNGWLKRAEGRKMSGVGRGAPGVPSPSDQYMTSVILCGNIIDGSACVVYREPCIATLIYLMVSQK
jgi:hypothetical protein